MERDQGASRRIIAKVAKGRIAFLAGVARIARVAKKSKKSQIGFGVL